MRLSHTLGRTSVAFDDPNLVSAGGLVPVLALAESAGLRDLAEEHLSVPTDKGANAGLKVSSLVGGMVAGADSIDDMALLRHGGMGRLFARAYAPSTLGTFLRAFTFGHVRQLDAIASRLLIALAGLTRLLGARTDLAVDEADDTEGEAGYALVDVDDTIIEVHGHAKQGAGFGYSGVRGLNALLATLTIPVAAAATAPVIVAQRLRKGAAGSPRGAKRLVGDAVKTTRRLLGKQQLILVRMDSAYYGRRAVHAALAGGADVSVTVRMDTAVKKAIAAIPDDAWTTIEYTDAVFDEATGRWISVAEVTEIDFTAFAAQKKADHVAGRLVIRRIPDFNADKHKAAGQDTLFDLWRFHAFFTTADPQVLDTVAADKTHRGHAVIEQVHADLKNSALAHLPSGVFTANAAWLVLAVIAFNLTRAAASLTKPDLAKATTATIRRTLITVPARVASSARRITLHLPHAWPWKTAWTALFNRVNDPPSALTT
ncbi:IS1380 family transposase [Phytoactinopolyspora mesophila]|uniref:IS1380 family transposase n=1 Tax=Phytoactinopolyspora mesophila TaxID=2650750 RepID=A0A7K3M4Z8_9ACTN|nr:IS1380 family transposase [Phytoactinopolyspora mesophila]NDL58391.1 IS1380 family transposase [Phytoactinopolyspora mesophila]